MAIQRTLTDFSLGVPSVRASMHASESWHSGTNAPNQGSGTSAVPPEFLSRRSWRPSPQSTSRTPRRPGLERCPPHLQKAPPRGRGSMPLPPWPQQLQRCPRTWQSCSTGRVPSDGRKGSARERLGSASFPSPPPTGGRCGASVRMRSRSQRRLLRGRRNGRRGGCARQASW